MTRLIDADDLERYIDNCDFCDRCPDASPRCQIDCEMPDFLTKRWKRVIDEQSTVDAEPVRHGHWNGIEMDSRGYTDMFECSECKCYVRTPFMMKVMEYDFCPSCGAKMDGGADGSD